MKLTKGMKETKEENKLKTMKDEGRNWKEMDHQDAICIESEADVIAFGAFFSYAVQDDGGEDKASTSE